MSSARENHILERIRFKANIFRVLSNPIRIRILEGLRNGERTVTEIRELLDIEAPHVSQQLAVLRSNNLVKTRKEGVKIYYSYSNFKIYKLLDAGQDL